MGLTAIFYQIRPGRAGLLQSPRGSAPSQMECGFMRFFITAGLDWRKSAEADGRVGIGIFDDRGRNKNDQIVLDHAFAFAAESPSQSGNIPQERHFGVRSRRVVLNQAAHDQRIAIGNHHLRINFALGK